MKVGVDDGSQVDDKFDSEENVEDIGHVNLDSDEASPICLKNADRKLQDSHVSNVVKDVGDKVADMELGDSVKKNRDLLDVNDGNGTKVDELKVSVEEQLESLTQWVKVNADEITKNCDLANVVKDLGDVGDEVAHIDKKRNDDSDDVDQHLNGDKELVDFDKKNRNLDDVNDGDGTKVDELESKVEESNELKVSVDEELECLTQWFDLNADEIIKDCDLASLQYKIRKSAIASREKKDVLLHNDDASSFDQGLSQTLTNTLEQSPVCKDIVQFEKSCIPSSSKDVMIGKRAIKPSAVLKSPFVKLTSDVSERLSGYEFAVSNHLFSCLEDKG